MDRQFLIYASQLRKGDLLCFNEGVPILKDGTPDGSPIIETVTNKIYKFPKQEKPGLDLVLMNLNDAFGTHSLDVHNMIVEVMEAENIPLEDKVVRKMLANMAIKLVNQMSNYAF